MRPIRRSSNPVAIPLRLLVLGLLAVPPLPAATYYVAPPPSGNNANAGSLAAPWATLQHAADTVGAGDTVLVRAGAYQGFQLETSGAAGLPITFRAYDGELVTITADNPTTPDGINLEGASWAVIEGFVVNGRSRAGIRAVLCDHVTIRGNHCDGNGKWGIFTGFCDDLLIEGNEASNSIDEHGIYVSNSGDRPTIRGNRIWDNNANGIHMNGDKSQGGDGIISDALVEKNVIWGNGTGGGSGINMDGVQNSIVRSNLIYDTHASGISLYQIDGGAPSTGNKILNNTVLGASNSRWALNIQDGSTGNTVRNNILWTAHSFRGSIDISADSLPAFSSDHNVTMERFTTDGGNTVLTLAQWRTATSQDTSSLVATPAVLFVAPGSDDYHLSATSPARDAGETRAEVPADLDGTPRPQGPAYDIGAYEYGAPLFVDGFESGNTSAWSTTS